MIRVNNEQYLTLQEYAKRENVTIQTVYNWIKNKKVETKKIMKRNKQWNMHVANNTKPSEKDCINAIKHQVEKLGYTIIKIKNGNEK